MSLKVLIFSMLVALIACSTPEQEKAETTAAKEPEINTVTLSAKQVENGGIVTAVPASRKMQTKLSLNGSIDVPPQNIVSVSFPFGGYLKSTKLLPGMHVNKGEVIGIMEDQSLVQLQQDYLVAVSRLKFLQQEYERQKTLQENQVNSAKTFQQVESDYNSQKVLVSGFAQKLRMIKINPDRLTDNTISSTVPLYSPIDGFVSRVSVNIGKFVNPTDVLFELINPDDMHAALVVFEKDIARVKKGQQVLVALVDDPSKTYECEVILVTRNVNEDRTGIIHCHFERMPETLMPGMFLNATVYLSEENALTVPEEAVVRYGNKEYVLQEQDKATFSLIPVQSGTRQDGFVQLLDSAGTLGNKPVVIKNAYAVLSTMKNTADED